MTTQTNEIPRLKARYRSEILPALNEQFGYANIMQVPGLQQGHAHRPQGARRRTQGPHQPQVRGSGGQMRRLRDRYSK